MPIEISAAGEVAGADRTATASNAAISNAENNVARRKRAGVESRSSSFFFRVTNEAEQLEL
jgi:hypothetical protein